MLLFILDALIVGIILGILFLLILIFWIIIHPCEALTFLGEGIVSLLGPIIGPIVRVFVTGGGELVCGAIDFVGKFFAGEL